MVANLLSKSSEIFFLHFIVSREVTQSTAWGTFNVKSGPLGLRTKIARVIRLRTNEELSRQIAIHLKQNGFENIPSRSTILRILSCCPAAKAKELRGVNATVEESRKAFTRLTKVLEEFQPLVAQNRLPGLNDELLDNLMQSVSTASRYFKSHYIYNLSKESKVASYCISCCSSDGRNPTGLD